MVGAGISVPPKPVQRRLVGFADCSHCRDVGVAGFDCHSDHLYMGAPVMTTTAIGPVVIFCALFYQAIFLMIYRREHTGFWRAVHIIGVLGYLYFAAYFAIEQLS